MIYPNLKFNPHAIERILERVGIMLDKPNAEEGFIKRIQKESIHVVNDGKNKELRLFRIGYKFYVVAIQKKMQLVLTVMFPQRANYKLSVQRFERSRSMESQDKTTTCYIGWRKQHLVKKGWLMHVPSDNGLKQLKLWGDYETEGFWNGSCWMEEETDMPIPSVLGWKEVVVEIVRKTKVSKNINLCADCAKVHANVDESHFSHAYMGLCWNCRTDKPCLPVTKDKTNLFLEANHG